MIWPAHRGGTATVLLLSLLIAVAPMSGCGAPSAVPRVATARSGTPNLMDAPQASKSALDRYIDNQRHLVDCLRKNGLPDQADPDRFGQVLIDSRNVPSRTAMNTARLACQKLVVAMPPEVRDLVARAEAEALTDEQRRVYRQYADCMQDHGAPDFPDPEPNGLPGERDWDQTAPGVRAASTACAAIIGDPVDSGPGVG